MVPEALEGGSRRRYSKSFIEGLSLPKCANLLMRRMVPELAEGLSLPKCANAFAVTEFIEGLSSPKCRNVPMLAN